MYWIFLIIAQIVWLYLIRHKKMLLFWIPLYILEAICASWSIAEFLKAGASNGFTDWGYHFIVSAVLLVLILTTAIIHVCFRKDN